MPELPEVETTLRGIKPFLLGETVEKVVVRDARLRWPIKPSLPKYIQNVSVESLERRGKYILVKTKAGTAIWHLGMSGSLRIVSPDEAPEKHDHVDWLMSNGCVLRYRDPRRFGSLHWAAGDPFQHKLLASLGVEPFDTQFTGSYLYQKSRKRTVAVKQFIMNAQVVVGVGNIYANEALFMAGIRPLRGAGSISLQRYERLATAIKEILKDAIKEGGTTLRDFVNSSGNPGYFKQKLDVYGRGGEPCTGCGQQLIERQLGNRATVFCKLCQT